MLFFYLICLPTIVAIILYHVVQDPESEKKMKDGLISKEEYNKKEDRKYTILVLAVIFIFIFMPFLIFSNFN